MLFERFGYPERRVQCRDFSGVAGFRLLDTTFDLPDVFQVTVQANAIGSADFRSQRARFLQDRVENAAVFAAADLAFCRTSGTAEHALEGPAGIDLHWEASGLRGPGD